MGRINGDNIAEYWDVKEKVFHLAFFFLTFTDQQLTIVRIRILFHVISQLELSVQPWSSGKVPRVHSSNKDAAQGEEENQQTEGRKNEEQEEDEGTREMGRRKEGR